jgi:hypothetical protein
VNETDRTARDGDPADQSVGLIAPPALPLVDPKRKSPAPQPPPVERQSTVMRAIEADEEKTLKDWLDSLGTQGAYRVQVSREKPTHVMVAGKQVETKGFLETYEHSLTEEDIQREHGGGTYHLKITRQNKTGAFVYEKGMHRTIVVAGDPKTDRLPGNAPPPLPVATQTSAGESPTVVKMAFDAMQKTIDQQNAAPVQRGIDPAIQMVLDEMRRQTARADAEVAAVRAELAQQRHQKPEVDPIKDRLLGTLLDGQSGHVEALRIRHEAELRQLKESSLQDVKRIEDRHDRTTAELRASSERMMADLRASHDREIHAIRASHEVALASSATAHNVQSKILEATVVRLERDNTKLEAEVAALREKKDKPLIEQIKDMNALKEAIGAGDEESSPWSKMAELATNPEAIAAVGSIFRGAAPAPAPVAPPVPAKPAIVRDRATGEKYLQRPDGGLVPVKKKPKVIVREDGSQLQLPEVDPAQVAQVIAYMERAFAAGQDAETVARSSRTLVPPEILAWIQEHESETQSGVDLFLSKVAKLPGNSPLAQLAGRNWIRKVGKALIVG